MNNWFVIASGLCWVGATIQAAMQGNWRLFIVAVCYALAMATLEGLK